MTVDHIIIEGARENNLKNISVTIPRNKLTVITGLSGSGKSTLAFDTLFAEGQRRYVESLSTYARQFLGQMSKPDVDAIIGLSPAIAIEQRSANHNPRSTVGTATEIYDYLRLMFARVGKPFCHVCGRSIAALSIDQMMDRIMELAENTRIMVLAPIVTAQKGSHEKLFSKLRKDGFARVRVDQTLFGLEEPPKLDKKRPHTIEAVVDRLMIKKEVGKRLFDSLELALGLTGGQAIVADLTRSEDILLSESASCPNCNISYPEFSPASFSFNSPQGACPDCDGLGAVTDFDPDLIVPDKRLSLRQGAVLPWENRHSIQFVEFLDALVTHYKEDIYKPFQDLSPQFQTVLLHGSGREAISFYVERMNKRVVYQKPYEGIIPNLKRRFRDTESKTVRENLKPFMSFRACPTCRGNRLNRASSMVRVGGRTIWEITAMSIESARRYIGSVELDEKETAIARSIIKELGNRLGFLEDVGLGYLTLDRSTASLSGGENQRIRLATQIGSRLTGILYVLDEPSIGLHQKDNARLLTTLMDLRNLDNTVLLVEHDEDTIRSADHVIDIGPGAGVHGGEVLFSGTPEDLAEHPKSLTGLYLSGRKRIPIPEEKRQGSGEFLIVRGACANNLKNIDVSFPLGCLTCVTGVSGSGKSTLVLSTLYPILTNHFNRTRKPTGQYKDIQGLEHLNRVVHVDQSPIGKTPRSNPATYTQVFNSIRDLFAQTREAKARGYQPGRFSFNVRGGRCESCAGDGIIKIEMHFLPDVYVVCDVCKGRRYNRETLEVRYKGKNIAEVLDMTINQAISFFENIPWITDKLSTLNEVGLGYVKLGQPATTLSGGEAQRIKLSRELAKKGSAKSIYILDEPTTGLHPDDIRRLLSVLNQLADAGNTVVVIEHNLDVIQCADHIIDLGPDGGDKGGEILVQGPPEKVISHKRSYTGFYLKKRLQSADIRITGTGPLHFAGEHNPGSLIENS